MPFAVAVKHMQQGHMFLLSSSKTEQNNLQEGNNSIPDCSAVVLPRVK